MNQRISKNQMLAHIAAVADKSKVEDSDFLFFKNGIYKGEWNPNTSPNQLPNNKEPNAIYLVSENGNYFGKNLVVGELVRYDHDDKPILIYSKYLPIPFFLSMIDESDTTNNTGGGFVFGGEFDATPIIIQQDAVFDILNGCTFANDTITATTLQCTAISHHLSTVDAGTNRNFRINWPDTSSGTGLVVGLAQSTLTDFQQIINDVSSAFVGIASFAGTTFLLYKQAGQALIQEPYAGAAINVNDVVRLGYRVATSTLYINNETQANSTITHIALANYLDINKRPSLVIGVVGVASIDCSFDDSFGYPLQQDSISLNLPTDFSKTYVVSEATVDSMINGKVLKAGDFVNFYTVLGVTNAHVSRLISDTEIKHISLEHIINQVNLPTSDISAAIIALINQELNINSSSIYQSTYAIAYQTIDEQCQMTGLIDNTIQAAISN